MFIANVGQGMHTSFLSATLELEVLGDSSFGCVVLEKAKQETGLSDL
jgi:hypothetical protein